MFKCRACTKRCLQTLIGDSAVFQLPSQVSLSQRQISRSFNSSATDAVVDEYTENNYQPVTQNESFRERGSGTSERQRWFESRGTTPIDKKPAKLDPRADSAFFKKLKQLQDPLNLAKFIRTTLEKDDFETALLYVRSASKNMPCVVSWNHLVDYQFRKGQMTQAIKTYNEMKKRAQFPDAHTYTIIFRGCSEHPHIQRALQNGLSIYTSMKADKSRVKPTTIHMNAMLKLCSRANDRDAMLSIAGEMEGSCAPNNLTFTTILNSFRMDAIRTHGLDEEEIKKLRTRTVQHAYRIWEDVYGRWRKGDIFVDEELVCAMGRVLLLGGEQDVDDILSLVEQAMNIRRQLPRRDTAARRKIEPSLQGSVKSTEATIEDSTSNGDSSTITSEDSAPPNPFALTSPDPVPSKSLVHARPGQNTLSLVLQALSSLHNKEAATKYWNVFVNKLKIVPDANNYIEYLRILRVFRSSAEASELIQSMPKECLSQKAFRIAASACERDKNNHNSFANAGKILDVMQMHLPVPDIRALTCYLNVAISSTPGGTSPRKAAVARAQGQQILRALERLNPSYLNVRSLLKYGNPTAPRSAENAYFNNEEFKQEVELLIRRMVAAYNLLMDKDLVPRDMYGDLSGRRGKLASYIARSKVGNNPNYKGKPAPYEPPPAVTETDEASSVDEPRIFSRQMTRGFRAAVDHGMAPRAAVRGLWGRGRAPRPL